MNLSKRPNKVSEGAGIFLFITECQTNVQCCLQQSLQSKMFMFSKGSSQEARGSPVRSSTISRIASLISSKSFLSPATCLSMISSNLLDRRSRGVSCSGQGGSRVCGCRLPSSLIFSMPMKRFRIFNFRALPKRKLI